MLKSITDALPWWLLFPSLVLVFLLVVEAAFWLGSRHRGKADEHKKSHAAMVVGSMLALLGLLLGFTFHIAESRFETRRELVLEEANAIQTTYLRAEMLPPGRVEPTKELLRRYVEIRLDVETVDDLPAALDASASIHDALWSEALASSREDPQSRYIPLFVQSLNQVIYLQEARVTYAVYFRLPPPMQFALFMVALVAMAMIGLVLGLGRSRSFWPTLAVAAAVAAVLVLIVELDRPWQQLFDVGQSAMIDVQEAISVDR